MPSKSPTDAATSKKIQREDMTLGKVLLANKLVTQEEIKVCLQLQRKVRQATGMNLLLGEILVSRGYLDEETLDGILKVQAAKMELMTQRLAWREKTDQLAKTHDVSLGQLAMENKLLTREQLGQAVKLQKKAKEIGVEKRLGEILVERNLISLSALEGLLKVQKGRDRAPRRKEASARLDALEMTRQETGTRIISGIPDDVFLRMIQQYKFFSKADLKSCQKMQREMSAVGVKRPLAAIAADQNLVARQTLASMHDVWKSKHRRRPGKRRDRGPTTGTRVGFVLSFVLPILVVLTGGYLLFVSPGYLSFKPETPQVDPHEIMGNAAAAAEPEISPEIFLPEVPLDEPDDPPPLDYGSSEPIVHGLEREDLMEEALRRFEGAEFPGLEAMFGTNRSGVHIYVYGFLPSAGKGRVDLRLLHEGAPVPRIRERAKAGGGIFAAKLGPLGSLGNQQQDWFTVEASHTVAIPASVAGTSGQLHLALRHTMGAGERSLDLQLVERGAAFCEAILEEFETLYGKLRVQREQSSRASDWNTFVEEWRTGASHMCGHFREEVRRGGLAGLPRLEQSLRALLELTQELLIVYWREALQTAGEELPSKLRHAATAYQSVATLDTDVRDRLARTRDLIESLRSRKETMAPIVKAHITWVASLLTAWEKQWTRLACPGLAGEGSSRRPTRALAEEAVRIGHLLLGHLGCIDVWDPQANDICSTQLGEPFLLLLDSIRSDGCQYVRYACRALLLEAGQPVPEELAELPPSCEPLRELRARLLASFEQLMELAGEN